MKKLLSTFAICLCLFACLKQNDLKGNKFISNADNGTLITLGFDEKENRLYGKVVNNYFATYKLDGNNLMLNGVGSTMMMGMPDAMQTEQDFFEFLNSSPITYVIEGEELTLNNAKGDVIKFIQVEEFPEMEQ